jgi:hypothetical protein
VAHWKARRWVGEGEGEGECDGVLGNGDSERWPLRCRCRWPVALRTHQSSLALLN